MPLKKLKNNSKIERLIQQNQPFFRFIWKMKLKATLQVVELEDDNIHLVLPAVFKGDETGFWVIDTGASKTVFDLNLKNRYVSAGGESDQVHTAGIGDKPIDTAIGLLHPFSVGKYQIETLRVALLDLSHINRFYAQAANIKICGLLGSDFLLRHNAVVDYKKKLLVLEVKK